MDIEELTAIAVSEGLSTERLMALLEKLTPHTGVRPDGIVDLASLGLTPKQRAQRERSIGGSDARIIATGDPDKLRELAEIIRGEKPHRDLSGDLTVRCGHWLERLNLALVEEKAADMGYCAPGTRISRHGEVVRHPKVSNRHASLDGFLEGFPGFSGVVECKAAVGFQSVAELIDKFYAQLTHNADCLDADLVYLSMTIGTYKYVLQPVGFDVVYMAELAEAEARFWQSVERGVEPKPMKMPKPVLDLSTMVEADMNGNNIWADAAQRWLDHAPAAALLKVAQDDIKGAIPTNAKRAFGHGIQASKAKNGAVTINVLEAEPATEPAKEAAE